MKTKRKPKPAPVQQPLVGAPWETYERLLKRSAALEAGVLSAWMIFSENDIFERLPHGRAVEKFLENLISKMDIRKTHEILDLYPSSRRAEHAAQALPKPGGVPSTPSGPQKTNNVLKFIRRGNYA